MKKIMFGLLLLGLAGAATGQLVQPVQTRAPGALTQPAPPPPPGPLVQAPQAAGEPTGMETKGKEGDYKSIGGGVKYQLIDTYSVERLNQILTSELKEFSDFAVTYPPARFTVKLYRVLYPSVVPEQNNRLTSASGLLAVPEGGRETMAVVSYQHGTVFSKTAIPSNPEESMETRLMIAQFAGQGYAVVAADYFGKGTSSDPDSYLVKASAQQACLDMLVASRAVTEDLKLHQGPLFLSGWSEGGWTTMVFLNKLESLGIAVKGAAIASAPTDLFATINRWLHASEDGDAVYLPALLALQINAYQEYYGVGGLVQSAIKPQYQAAAHDLYVNKLTWDEAAPKLPKHAIELLRDDFAAASSVGKGPYWDILQTNQAYRWRANTPLHTYYGDADEVIPSFIAALPVGYQKVMDGAETTGIEIPGANHRGTFVSAIAAQKEWFDSLLNPKTAQ